MSPENNSRRLFIASRISIVNSFRCAKIQVQSMRASWKKKIITRETENDCEKTWSIERLESKYRFSFLPLSFFFTHLKKIARRKGTIEELYKSRRGTLIVIFHYLRSYQDICSNNVYSSTNTIRVFPFPPLPFPGELFSLYFNVVFYRPYNFFFSRVASINSTPRRHNEHNHRWANMRELYAHDICAMKETSNTDRTKNEKRENYSAWLSAFLKCVIIFISNSLTFGTESHHFLRVLRHSKNCLPRR